MKKLVASLMAFVGMTSAAQPASTTMDPNTILFSLPTISNDLAEMEDSTATQSDLVLNEDDWTQVEFFAAGRLPEIKHNLAELKNFERTNRVDGSGWKNVYARKIERTAVMAGEKPIAHLESLLGVKSARGALIASGGEITGRIKNGFTLNIGGNIALYGYTKGDGIRVLAASVGANPDNLKLSAVFAKLNASDGLILVDWRNQMLLAGTKDGHIEIWRP